MKRTLINRSIYFWFIPLTIVVLLILGCSSTSTYEENISLDGRTWDLGDSLVFHPEITDTSLTYAVFLNIDHLKSYPFENIYIRLRQDLSGELNTDTLNLDLIGRDGLYRGTCDAESCRIEALLYPQLKLNSTGSFSVIVEQFTREASLKGIQEVGLVIRKAHLEPESN